MTITHKGAAKRFSLAAYATHVAHDLDLVDQSLRTRVPGMIRARQYAELEGVVKEASDPSKYGDHLTYLQTVTLLASVKKLETNVGLDTTTPALLKYLESEEKCLRTNTAFERLQYPKVLCEKISRIVARIVGEFRYGEFIFNARHGKGSAVGIRGKDTTEFFRWTAKEMPVTELAERHIARAFQGTSLWMPLAAGSYGTLISTVPKTMWIERVMGLAVMGNLYGQLGIDEVLFRRNYHAGISTRDQRTNRALARHAAMHGTYATIDLSSASDLISYRLVERLFNYSRDTRLLFELMVDLREGQYALPSAPKRFLTTHKFSPMGNGFCFQLQSLIFYSIALAVQEMRGVGGIISVYGDDIIVPVELFHHMVEALTLLGLEVNESKSFSTGPFRESCGSDWWGSYPVRPVFLHEIPVTISQKYNLLNRLRRGNVFLPSAYDYVKSLIPPKNRRYGPTGVEPAVGHIEASVPSLYAMGALRMPRRSKNNQTPYYQAPQYRTLVTVPRNYRRDYDYCGKAEEVLCALALRDGAREDPLPITKRKDTAVHEVWTELRVEPSLDAMLHDYV